MVFIPAGSVAGLTGGTQLAELLQARLRGEGLGIPKERLDVIRQLEQQEADRLIREQIRPEIARAGAVRGIGGRPGTRATLLTDILTRRLGDIGLQLGRGEARRRLSAEELKRQELTGTIGAQLRQEDIEASQQRARAAAELKLRQLQMTRDRPVVDPFTRGAQVLSGIGGALTGLGAMTGFFPVAGAGLALQGVGGLTQLLRAPGIGMRGRNIFGVNPPTASQRQRFGL